MGKSAKDKDRADGDLKCYGGNEGSKNGQNTHDQAYTAQSKEPSPVFLKGLDSVFHGKTSSCGGVEAESMGIGLGRT